MNSALSARCHLALAAGKFTYSTIIAPVFTCTIIQRRCIRMSAKNDDDDEEDIPAPGKALRVERLLANLGYGKRKECQQMVLKGRAVRKDGKKLKVGDKVLHTDIMLEEEELDAPFPVAVMVNKPVGYVVTAPDDDKILDPKVYDLLPYRFGRRRPFLSSVGRLDKATSGMLILTDDGQLVHRINTPKKGIWKVYEAKLAAPLVDKDAEAAFKNFASGTLQLTGDYEPLLPAKLVMISDTLARVSICEGRYHQIRRMFTAIGHEVLSLHRVSVGGLTMEGLPDGEWKYLTQADIDAVFSGPSAEEVLAEATGTTKSMAVTAESQQPQRSRASNVRSASISDRQINLDIVRKERSQVQAAAVNDSSGGDEGEGEEEAVGNTTLEVKKLRQDERWKRRRLVLKTMVVKNM